MLKQHNRAHRRTSVAPNVLEAQLLLMGFERMGNLKNTIAMMATASQTPVHLVYKKPDAYRITVRGPFIKGGKRADAYEIYGMVKSTQFKYTYASRNVMPLILQMMGEWAGHAYPTDNN